jgi:hypothetical protein
MIKLPSGEGWGNLHWEAVGFGEAEGNGHGDGFLFGTRYGEGYGDGFGNGFGNSGQLGSMFQRFLDYPKFAVLREIQQ